MFSSRVRRRKAYFVEQKTKEFKGNFHSTTFDPKKLIRKATANMNNI